MLRGDSVRDNFRYLGKGSFIRLAASQVVIDGHNHPLVLVIRRSSDKRET